MAILGSVLATLGAQALLGCAIYCSLAWLLERRARGGGSRRRRRTSWAEASRALLRASPWFVALLLAGLVLDPGRSALAAPGALSLVVPGALATSSGYVLLLSAARQARGRLRSSRRLVRLGGFLLALGILLLLVATWAELLFHPALRRAVVVGSTGSALALAAGMLALGGAAFIGLLAGLSGKARPTGYFALLFYVAGAAGLAGALHLAARQAP
jgi:hypothetical protein